MGTQCWLRKGAAAEAVVEIAVLILLFFVFAAPASAQPGGEPTTPPIVDEKGQPLRGGFASLEAIVVGGVKQHILLRGRDAWNPVLLYLNSQPGVSHMAWSRHFNPDLEKHFIVVNWDQRGAGKSFNPKLTDKLTLDQYVSDAIEVTEQLRARFRQDKVYLVGHGFGGLVGALAAQKRPELFHALVAVAPMVAAAEDEQAAYRYALDAATKAGDQATLGQLKTLGAPPYAGTDMFANYTTLRQAALRAAGAAYPANPFRATGAEAVATAPEYSEDERQRLPQAEADTFAVMYPQLARIDLTKQVPALGIPVYVIAGRFDATSSAPSVERWVETLQAPAKSHTWFELSGRAPTYEEPDKFLQVMVTRVLTETLRRREVTH